MSLESSDFELTTQFKDDQAEYLAAEQLIYSGSAGLPTLDSYISSGSRYYHHLALMAGQFVPYIEGEEGIELPQETFALRAMQLKRLEHGTYQDQKAHYCAIQGLAAHLLAQVCVDMLAGLPEQLDEAAAANKQTLELELATYQQHSGHWFNLAGACMLAPNQYPVAPDAPAQ